MDEPKKGQPSPEDEWAKAAKAGRGAALRDGARSWTAVLVAGATGVLALFGTYGLWPFEKIPIVFLFGIPVVAGGAAYLLVMRVLGGRSD